MTTTFALAISASLFTASPAGPGYENPGAAAVAPDEGDAQLAYQRGDASDDRPRPRVQARQPRRIDSSATERALADPSGREGAAAPKSSDIDAYLFQQQTWTGP